MTSRIHHIDIDRYDANGNQLDSEEVSSPAWSVVESAIRQMDNYCRPLVYLFTGETVDDGEVFAVCGGDGRWALFDFNYGGWQYEDPEGGDEEVRLWDSDQGYVCCEKNVLTDIEKVLRITKHFYETASFDELDLVE